MAWGKLAEKQDKGISEHIEPFLFFWYTQTSARDRLRKHCTASGFVGLEQSLY